MKFKPKEKTGGVVVEMGPKEPQLPRPASGEGAAPLPTFNLKNILVPVDFTECTEEAVMYAVAFARQFDAGVTLLHVIEPAYIPPSEMGGVELVESKSEALEKLDEFRVRHLSGVRSSGLVKRGTPEFEIISVAKELGSNLIILATHGRTGFSRMLLGSTAEHIVRHASCPILIVRPNEREFVGGVKFETAAVPEDKGTDLETQMISGL